MNTLLSIIKKFRSATVLVVGDVMLDIYVYGSVETISPEAPIPIFRIKTKSEMLGGAGNVTANLSSLGANSIMLGVVGDDEQGAKIKELLSKMPRVSSGLLTAPTMPTVTKTRYVSGQQQVLRTDVEDPDLMPSNFEDKICEKAITLMSNCNVVVVSDYKKGVITRKTCEVIIQKARSKDIPVLIDPKGADYSMYANATLIKPNHKVFKDIFSNINTRGKEVLYARKLLSEFAIEFCLLTLGKDGMLFVSREQFTAFNSVKTEVCDVSGAGDTVIATLAASYGSGASIEQACFLSNLAGGIVVGKFGTSTVTSWEIEDGIQLKNKKYSLAKLLLQIEVWRRRGYSIGFTNGCFDLLHAGHIQMLTYGSKYCDKLIVGLNSDSSVKTIKGVHRPVNDQEHRLLVLSELECIDAIVLFENETPEKLIYEVKPDVLIKGGDYSVDGIVGGSFVKSYGGKIILAPFFKDLSTTKLISRLQCIEEIKG